jgi:hypothetical protein
MRTARELLSLGKLQSVEVQISDKDKICECHWISFNHITDLDLQTDYDEFMTEMELQIKTGLNELSRQTKSLKKLPKETTFKIVLHTTEQAFFQMQNNPVFEKLPFVQDTSNEIENKGERTLIPIGDIKKSNLSLSVEVYE